MFARLLALFICVPLVEMYLFLQVGQWIGPLPTVLIVLVTGVLGAWLTRTQGMQVVNRFRSALAQGRIPQQEVLEGLLILVAGVLLLTPGFITDTAGYLLLVPPLRLRAGQSLRRYLLDRFRRVTGMEPKEASPVHPPNRPRTNRGGPVVDAEILDEREG